MIINKDMEALRRYKNYLTKNFMESEVERRVNKYTSHIAFHLYQMYQSAIRGGGGRDNSGEDADERHRAEINRVSSTLLKLMEVSR